MTDLGSIVIAAFNEEDVIGRCLEALRGLKATDELDIVVVCNGCTDRTAERARATGIARVVELPVASKVAALNMGDEVVAGFPRIYLDADTIFMPASIAKTLAHLRDPPSLAARPSSKHDLMGRPYAVKAYYRTRENLPSLTSHLWGAGIYGLSELGRKRFGSFPPVIADDLYVDQQFELTEIDIVDCEPVVVDVPRTTRALMRMMRRVYVGKDEQSVQTEGIQLLREMVQYARCSPRAASDALMYLMLVLIARVRGKVPSKERWNSGRS